MRVTVGALVLGLLVSACTPSSDDGCPDTVVDAEGGTSDGLDLAAPVWLPAGIVLPVGLGIRHLADGRSTATGHRVLVGFVPGADQESLAAEIVAGLASWEILLEADGFVPVANPLLAAMGSGNVVWVDVTAATAPVRVGDECEEVDGVQVGFVFDEQAPDEARAWFEGSSLGRGTAHASVGDEEFDSTGECLVLDTLRSYTSTSGAGIGVQYDPPVGFASVDVEGETVLNLDVERTRPVFETSTSGYSVEGTFIDGLGDLGMVEGRIVVVCEG